MSHSRLKKEARPEAETSGRPGSHVWPVHSGSDSWLKTNQKKRKTKQKPDRGSKGSLAIPQSQSGGTEALGPGPHPRRRGSAPAGGRAGGAPTTQRCSGGRGLRTSRCQWDGSACLSALASHPETRRHTARRVALWTVQLAHLRKAHSRIWAPPHIRQPELALARTGS